MNSLKVKVLGTVAAVAASISIAIPAAMSQSVVKVDGSSTVFPITEAAAESFTKETGGKIRVTVGVSGTGGGFRKFCRGETDISNASRPILQKEIDECKKAGINYIELPVGYDGLTVVINPQNTWARNLTTAELRRIWEPAAQGKITNWSQVRAGFPNVPLRLFGPGTASGTFDYFTEAINGKAKASRGDYTASEDDNVLVNGVTRDRGGLGYFGFSYFVENRTKLTAASVNGVAPSEQTIRSGKYTPLSRPVFIYVNAKSAQNPAVRQFVTHYLRNGVAINRRAKTVSLPGPAYATVLNRFNSNQTGSVLGGKEKIGITLQELLARPR
ncbi:phosphate ABC transporter periplasmic phosphate-binding protein [Calothrix sp. NIES-3974]|nr:PstS family phosphate ABC transporter substrate-binding protein [Calothrix sp. NIES-3974]BAZ04882.1 phosphate ABC transporter periplasmic phosphate-binding protein [Calothrix sp. NIES-3974]